MATFNPIFYYNVISQVKPLSVNQVAYFPFDNSLINSINGVTASGTAVSYGIGIGGLANTAVSLNGTSSEIIANTTYGSGGSTSQRIGNTNYNSDGSSSQQIGNTLYNSNGSTVQKIGNTTYGSDGTTCQKIGSSTYCN